MKKQIKTKMLSLALIAGVAATAGALALNHSANQAAAEENAAVFQMENSVRLRLNGNGLAFSVKMDEAKYNEIKNDENKSLYFIVMPSMYLVNVKTADGYDYAKAIARDGNGDYNYTDSHCLYVNASEAIYKSGEDYYALGGVSDVLETNRKLDFVAVACVEARSESGFTYEYAALPEGKTQMPTISQYTTLSKSVLYSTTDYSAQIAQYYSWFGKGEYALTIATTEDYKALVGKINGGADLAGMELRINSGVDKEQAKLNEGMALPATQTTYSTVKFYDDDGTTLLSSADVNDGGSVTPITPEKAATEEYTYTFEKWVTEKGGDVAASFKNITANMSVYAKYTAVKNKITITWKKNAADEGITEIYNRGETPQYKGETLKNYFEGDKYYICKGFENIVPAEEDTTYVCSWEEHAGKETTLTYWFAYGADTYFKTDIAKDTNSDQTVTFEVASSVRGKTSCDVLVHHSGDLEVLAFRIDYKAQEGEMITFNDAVAVYNGEYLGIKDGTMLLKGSEAWAVVDEIVNVSLSSWFGSFLYTDITVPVVTEDILYSEITFKATSSTAGGEKDFTVKPRSAAGKDKLVFEVISSAEEGEIITFNNSIAKYNNQALHIADGTQLIYKNGRWYTYEKPTLTYWFGSIWFKTDIAKDTNADLTLTFTATSSVSGNISFSLLAHHPGGEEVLAFRTDYKATEGEIITFKNSFAEYYGTQIELDGLQLIYQNGAWAVYNG